MTAGGPSETLLRAHLREMPLHRVVIRTIEARILSEVQFPRPILDIGCGDGHFGSVLFPAGAEVGLDPGVADLAEARRRGVYRLLTAADSGVMPFGDARFGSVVSNCVFEHIPRIDRTISEIARVTKPGGVFATTVIGEHFREFLTDAKVWRRFGLSAVHRAYVDWFNRKAVHFHFDSPATWRDRFEAAGFDVLSWRYYMSAAATHAFHRIHYVSLPQLAAKKWTGRWVPFPSLMDNDFWTQRLSRWADEPEPNPGSCIAFVCRRRAEPPVK